MVKKMIKISAPNIEKKDDGFTYLCSHISSDVMNIETDVWYRSDDTYSKYFVTETADAFVLPMCFLALKNHEDIEVQAPISEKLYYNITSNITLA